MFDEGNEAIKDMSNSEYWLKELNKRLGAEG